jgi:serine/threonine-protein kinase RsbW
MMPLATKVEKDSMSDPGPKLQSDVIIPSDPGEARRVREEIEHALQAHRYSEQEIFGIKLALEEAMVNAIKHGNQLDRTKKVSIHYRVQPERFEVRITDEGPGFDPCDLPDPTAPENLERCCGRGLMLMRHYMTEVHFSRLGNSVSMCKLRNGNHKK